MKRFFAIFTFVGAAACGGSGTQNNGGITGGVTPPPTGGSAVLAATISASDVTDFETTFAETDALLFARSVGPSLTPVTVLTYNGQLDATFRLDNRGVAFGDVQRILGDMSITVDLTDPTPSQRLSGTASNFNLVDTAGAPVEALAGQLNVTGAFMSPGTRDLNGRADGTLTGRFGQQNVGNMQVILTLAGDRRGARGIVGVSSQNPNAAITGEVGGSGSGDFTMTQAHGDFYVDSR